MSRSLRAILDEAQPGKLPDANRLLQMGEAMGLVPRTFRGAVVANVLVLPEAAKCAALIGGYGEGTVPGYKLPLATGAAPATLQAAPNAAGDILFNAATDVITAAEVQYLAYEGPIVEDLMVVDTGTDIAAFLGGRAASVLLDVEALTGAVAGPKTPALRATAAPATTLAALTEDGLGVLFNAATDAVLTCRVRYIAQPGVGDTRISVSQSLDAVDKDF